MATSLIFYPTPLFLILLGFSLSLSLANVPQSSKLIEPESVCSSTPHPTFCKSLFPPNKPCNILDYFHSSAHMSLSTTRKFLYLLNRYRKRSSLWETAIRALDDCRLLSELNIDFLLSSMKVVNSTNTLSIFRAHDVQSLLSAILTNQITCFDSLNSTALMPWSVKNGLHVPLSTGTKMYSVSLSLFTHGWVKNQNKAIPEGNLVKTTTGSVTVREKVVVRQDGKGDFTTINDAVAAAPNGTSMSGGYFVIYVVAGIYPEYVTIDKNKTYIMMIGDGINQTVITGNRSVNDGWTTFNSATLG
ncbi:hypothetical protein NE237_010915 [Protea cynaroides]|uniref:Pectinesterase inhibitor domain-containing protein n=1 Tax=Protea cynaroides TaxID=273540 RepID=A0A9Q0L0Q1_9MAGN|nr:hypothetical protein NE237_010915 [Protea cynaroides]